VVHAVVLTMALRRAAVVQTWLATSFLRDLRTVTTLAFYTVLAHLTEILLFAVLYTYTGAMPDLRTASYFSAVTYTTVGYGDLVLPPDWRLVGGIEALTGILMCGWSTGVSFAAFSRMIQRRSGVRTPGETGSDRPPG
jgi:hypothetical protein